MGIVVPGVAKNYESQTVAIASKFGKEPPEGRYQIPFEIDWGTMGGADNVVNINLQTSGGTKEISQMCAVHVDNSDCGADVQFIFTDTAETITIPAYTPYYLVPVFSRSLAFFVASGLNGQVVESNDVTRFSVFNFVPPPVIGAVSDQTQNAAVFDAIDASAVADTQVVPVGTNGEVEVFNVFGQIISGGGQAQWVLKDGTGKIIAGSTNNSLASGGQDNVILNLSGLKVPFQNGLKFSISASSLPANSTYSVNLYYRDAV